MDPRNFDADLMSEMISAMGKELKLGRAKIQSLEGQDFKGRAESAEYALGVMKKNFEDVCLENQQLKTTLEELRDSKAWIKKEKTEAVDQVPREEMIHSRFEKSVSTEPLPDHVQDLEHTLQMYYQKYKEQKESKRRLREKIRDLEGKVTSYESQIHRLKTNAASKVSVKVQTCHFIPRPSRVATSPTDGDRNIYKFMAALPKPSNSFRPQRWKPVCNIAMDLKSFLAEDPKCKEVGTNFLCLPGRVVWCPPTDRYHAFAVAPLYTYNLPKQDLSENKTAFDRLYGQTFHLFYTMHESIFYAGLYKGVDLQLQNSEGVSMRGSDLSWKALAGATLSGLSSPKIDRLLATLYRNGALKVQVLGLQLVDCDQDIHEMLTSRFSSIRSALNPVGQLGGYYPEVEKDDRPSKKQKIVF